jgi:hypothetical protein
MLYVTEHPRERRDDSDRTFSHRMPLKGIDDDAGISAVYGARDGAIYRNFQGSQRATGDTPLSNFIQHAQRLARFFTTSSKSLKAHN